MKVGAILFDAVEKYGVYDGTVITPGSAWASIGGQKAKRIESIQKLPNDVIWFTNLKYSNFMKAGYHKFSNIRDEEWIKTAFHHLVNEIGIDSNKFPVSTSVEVIATIAQRVVDGAKSLLGVKPLSRMAINNDFALAMGAPRSVLADDIYSFFKPICKYESVNVIEKIPCSGLSQTIILRRNRVSHARDVMSTLCPSDFDWHMKQPTADNMNDSWLESIKTPFLVQCSISHVKPEIAGILSWGSGFRMRKDWLTDIEWRVVRKYGTLTIHQALICDSPATSLKQEHLVPKVPCAELSISYGLIAENIWTAMTLAQPHSSGEMRFTATAAWLRSADRMRMFDFAKRLSEHDLNVINYGSGRVVVRYPVGSLKRVLDIGLDVGLMPPGNKVMPNSK